VQVEEIGAKKLYETNSAAVPVATTTAATMVAVICMSWFIPPKPVNFAAPARPEFFEAASNASSAFLVPLYAIKGFSLIDRRALAIERPCFYVAFFGTFPPTERALVKIPKS
jgi:hypothetical protein